MKIGPETRAQLQRLSKEWRQGEHVLVSGPTGSGKTRLARELDQVRIDNGGFVLVMVAKLKPDKTITDEYKGFTRWTKMKRKPGPHENKVLLWPKLDGMPAREALPIQREIFSDAFDVLSQHGKWTVHVTEGLYTCSPTFLNKSADLAMLHALGRSADITCITEAQRPSHLPLILYGSASHAFVGRTRESSDLKRLSELGSKLGSKELGVRIAEQGRHDFLWLPIAPDWDAETVNVAR